MAGVDGCRLLQAVGVSSAGIKQDVDFYKLDNGFLL
jgi:hypothetical protein